MKKSRYCCVKKILKSRNGKKKVQKTLPKEKQAKALAKEKRL